MKKILLLCLLSFNSFGQTKEILKKTSEVIVDTKNNIVATTKEIDTSSVSHKIYGDVKTVVANIAKGLGIAAEKVYTVITKKYMIEGVVGLVMFTLSFILLLYYLNVLRNFNSDYLPGYIIGGLIVLIIFGNQFTNLSVNLNKTFNAEYYTIQFIFEQLKQLK